MELPKDIKSQQISILKKDYSHVELLEEYLKRIEKYDPKINSFLLLLKESAYKQAKYCDKLISEFGDDIFKKYPLLGVVTSVKDIFSVKNVKTTAGSKLLSNYYPPYDATIISKLKNAGIIIIGKTNCDAWAHGSSGENSDFGFTRNPWNYEYVPGGSSSGSSASLASNFCLLSTGTDTGGSIRLPANFCGVVGLKPSYGAVSRYGVIAMSSSFDCIGHFTNNIDDSEKVLNITKGIDRFDTTTVQIKKVKTKNTYTLGVPKEFFNNGLDKEVYYELKKVIGIFERNNFNVKEVSLPLTKYAISVYYIIQPSEVSSNLARFDGIRYGYDRTYFSPEAKRRIMLGTYALSAGYYNKYYLKALEVKSKIIEQFDKTFLNVDALIAPVSPSLPFKIGEKIDDPLKMYLADIFTVAANITGIPGLAIPSGFSKSGMPMGFQILTARYNDELLFDIGKKFEIFNKSKIIKPELK